MNGIKLLAMLSAAAIAIGVTACGGGDDEGTPPEQAAPVSGKIEIPQLTRSQKADAMRIAKADPLVVRLIEGQKPVITGPGPWTRSNQELLGAGIEFKLKEPRDLGEVSLPSIDNRDSLYGDQGEGDPGPIEPNVLPEIGETAVMADNVERFVVMVDLEAGRVAELTILSGDVEFE